MQRHGWPRDSHANTCVEWIYQCEDMDDLNVVMQIHALSGDAKNFMDMHSHANTCMVWR